MTSKPGEFSKRVWELARMIPPGKVTTYGALAVAAGGHPMMAQMITTIVGKAPGQENMPYHRIVYSDGRVWLFNDPKKRAARLRLYQKEGIKLDAKFRIIDFESHIFLFD